jgi:hypothetical protein
MSADYRLHIRTDSESDGSEKENPQWDVGLAILGNAAAVVEAENDGQGPNSIAHL